jgi:hypothetical protein
VNTRADEIYRESVLHIAQGTDRQFLWLMVIQWHLLIVASLWISPLAWAGTHSEVHPHVWVALFLGGAVTIPPIALILLAPGEMTTRCVIAV